MEVLGNCNARALRVRGYNSAEPEVISAVHCCATALLERISRPFADPSRTRLSANWLFR
jgi:hypothetical protein